WLPAGQMANEPSIPSSFDSTPGSFFFEGTAPAPTTSVKALVLTGPAGPSCLLYPLVLLCRALPALPVLPVDPVDPARRSLRWIPQDPVCPEAVSGRSA